MGKKKEPTYTLTCAKYRELFIRRQAEREGTPIAKARKDWSSIAYTEWLKEVMAAVKHGLPLSPTVLRDLGRVFGSEIFNTLATASYSYDWSYAQPVLERIKARETAAK